MTPTYENNRSASRLKFFFRRSSVGFDRMLQLLDNDSSFDNADYTPYNIVRTDENSFRISLAAPCYKPDQLDMVAHQNVLTVVVQGGASNRTGLFASRHQGRYRSSSASAWRIMSR